MIDDSSDAVGGKQRTIDTVGFDGWVDGTHVKNTPLIVDVTVGFFFFFCIAVCLLRCWSEQITSSLVYLYDVYVLPCLRTS